MRQLLSNKRSIIGRRPPAASRLQLLVAARRAGDDSADGQLLRRS